MSIPAALILSIALVVVTICCGFILVQLAQSSSVRKFFSDLVWIELVLEAIGGLIYGIFSLFSLF